MWPLAMWECQYTEATANRPAQSAHNHSSSIIHRFPDDLYLSTMDLNIEPKLFLNILKKPNSKSHTASGLRRRQQTYHGGLCDRAETVDENVAGDVYGGTCSKENGNESKTKRGTSPKYSQANVF